MGWGAGMQDGRRYGNDYDASEEEEPAVISLRMPGVYVQQVYLLIIYLFICTVIK